jgi:hypothetical protein
VCSLLKSCVQFLMDTILNSVIAQFLMKEKGDLRPILEASCIQFPNIGAVMSNEERRSSLASTTAGVDNRQAPASRPSIEPDTIDNLAQPIACSHMLLVGGSF